jgi:molybdate transport system ATP-binding protein
MVDSPRGEGSRRMISVDVEKAFSDVRNHSSAGSARAITRVSAKFKTSARVLGVFGKSGSGKTTLVNLIAGIETATRGRIAIGNDTILDTARGIVTSVNERQIGYVFQDALLFPHLSVEKNLRYGERRGDANARRVSFAQVVSLLGIDALLNRKPGMLSGGEKQRVAIGRALLSNPRLMLMDEPLASLDQDRRNEILKLIERVRDECGTRIVYVSHSIAEISRLTDEVVLMNDGAMIACGPTETIFNRRDLRPYTGRYEGGALIEATVTAHDNTYFMSTLQFAGGQLVAPGVDVSIGTQVRVRIRARDVSIATRRPESISIRNVIEGVVESIDDQRGAIVEVHVKVGETMLLARISRLATDEMKLRVGVTVYVLVKAIAFDKRSIGFAGT